MYDTVKIGEKEVPMLAMATVDIYYRHCFGEDPLVIQTQDNPDMARVIQLFQQLGFIMAKFAETKSRKEMLKLNEESYLEWLEQFERNDIIAALPDIRAVYDGEKATSSQEKKQDS